MAPSCFARLLLLAGVSSAAYAAAVVPAVDCTVGAWGSCSACSATCGAGVAMCARQVRTPPEGAGKGCPPLYEQRPCTSPTPCPFDCTVSGWRSCSQCSKSCGGGVKLCTREVVEFSRDGGAPCPELVKADLPCHAEPCTNDCQVSAWSAWSPCDRTCGGGAQRRNRAIESDQRAGGAACPVLAETRVCAAQGCPVDCAFTSWGAWSLACTKSCGGGIYPRTRKLTRAAENGGACPTLPGGGLLVDASRKCNEVPCPAGCQVTEPACSPCSKSCGVGEVTCTKTLVSQPAPGGEACPDLVSRQACNTHPCPADARMSDWACSACSVTCGEGAQTCTRFVRQDAQFGGRAAGELTKTQPCSGGFCPIDCKLSSWGAWSPCTRSCGWGQNRRTRYIVHTADKGGRDCPTLLMTKTCMDMPCTADCSHVPWSCTGCTKTCGMGSKNCVRKKTALCPELTKERACNWQSCPIDCQLSDWTWGKCSASCGGGGAQVGTRHYVQQAFFGGRQCENAVMHKTRACGQIACPVDCEVAAWSCEPCSHTCGAGQHTCRRAVLTAAAHGGAACPAVVKAAACLEKPCQTACQTSSWGSWTSCSATCGTGTVSRTRHVTTAPAHGAPACPVLVQHISCKAHTCPIDCVLSAWGNCGACSQTCGADGTRRCTRTVVTEAQHGGKACAATLARTSACPAQPACGGDCRVSDWGGCDPCTKTCGGGKQTCHRNVVSQPSNGGKACPALSGEQPCGSAPCPVDCAVTAWDSCSQCTRTCGGGKRLCTRTVTNGGALHGGKACPALTETQACNADACPVDCTVASWSAWSTCDRTCGTGGQIRTRQIATSPAHGGTPCPAQSDTQVCNTQPCPINCQVYPWSPFDSCSATCGGGVTVRSRGIFRMAARGGVACPALIETKPCNTHPCELMTCHADHVSCEMVGGLAHARLHVVHPKRFQHVEGAFHCKKLDATGNEDPRMFTGCKCLCDKHPGCCSLMNMVLANTVLIGNTFKEVPSAPDCCNLCSQHPHCESWEYSSKKVCMLKAGPPQYKPLSDDLKSLMVTWAGPRGGESCPANATPAPAINTAFSSTRR